MGETVKRLCLALVVAGSALAASPAEAQSSSSRVRVPIQWYSATATAYSTEGCDSSGGGSSTAMGTRARFGEVANNYLPLGTRIYFTKAIYGRHYFTVEDRIGWGSELDVWLHCGNQMGHWNNPFLRFYTYKWKKRKPSVSHKVRTASVGADWSSALNAYTGGSYGTDRVNQLWPSAPHGKRRGMVLAAAIKHRVPFRLLLGVWGAESGFGQFACHFGLTGFYPSTGTSGSFGHDADIAAGLFQRLYRMRYGRNAIR